ncbi:NADP-dependent oxidoreductase [Streptomyces sp. SID13031]|uniref:NADP-dependent oxidoreductase n=1 Tax=Streptomyces sp. SID13031 TaxID=2706046 RepID=UPI0013CCB2E9|nr:NADP-dependent oxidoreductase [Streptomyces sp. SID13031]NEA36882.1 NADP-dependent oxidoreductase [Streptomyces sp. SID13031]
MRKVIQRSLGGPEALEVVEVDVPEPGMAEVLVEVKAAGVNPVDWKVRRGGLGYLPFSVGWDVSGVVRGIGPGVTRFQVGDEVFGMPRFPLEAAAYAEFVTGPSRQFALKPSGMSHVQAAGLSLAGLTAWQALVSTAGLEAGQRVLIPAGGGGVGHLAVQIAKSRGAYVIATASTAKHDFVRGLGADEVIDYRSVDVGSHVAGVDVLLATVAGQLRELEGTLTPGGWVIALNGADAEAVQQLSNRGLHAVFMLVEPDRADLEALAALVRSGALTVHIDQIFPLEQVAEAHRFGEQGRSTGKIILSP